MKKIYFMLICLIIGISLNSCHDKITHKIRVYHNGDILTMKGDEPIYAKAIEVRDNTIMKVVYTDEDEKSLINNAYAEVIDLKGKISIILYLTITICALSLPILSYVLLFVPTLLWVILDRRIEKFYNP